jgi:hypothetical protein
LKQLREGIRYKCPDKWQNNNWFLHHDNMPANTSLIIQQFLTSKNITVILPPNHLTLPPTISYSPKMKLQLIGCRFDTTEEIHAESQEVIDTLTYEKFQGNMWVSLYTCPRGLLQRRQWKLGVTVRNFFYGQIPQSFE